MDAFKSRKRIKNGAWVYIKINQEQKIKGKKWRGLSKYIAKKVSSCSVLFSRLEK